MVVLPRFPFGVSRTAAILLLLVVVPATGTIGDPSSIEEVFKQQRAQPKDFQPNVVPVWGKTWQLVLHNQIDGLFSSLKERATHNGMVEGTSEGSPVNVGVNKDPEFKIVIVGDSTMQMQAMFLRWILLERTSEDGRSQCFISANVEYAGFTLHCKEAS
ncbi:unnamed protein product, partial [Ectocarpus fasciculatus]